MRNLILSALVMGAMQFVLIPSANAGPVILTLNPSSGSISALPGGASAGWGFNLTNDTASFLSVDSVQLFSPVDDPLFRFGPTSNFTDIFSVFQFSAPTILISPNSTFSQAYNAAAGQGLASWTFPANLTLPLPGGSLFSNVFQIQVSYSLWNDNAYNNPTVSGGVPVTGTMLASAQLRYVQEPATWMLIAPAVGIIAWRRKFAEGRAV